MKGRRFSRRDFLRLSATAIAGAIVAACQPAAPVAKPEAAPGEKPAKVAEAIELRFIKLSMSDPVSVYFNETAIPKFQEANPGLTVKVDMSAPYYLDHKVHTDPLRASFNARKLRHLL